MPKKLKARLFASLSQCSTALKISIEALRKAKRMGCVAFRANGSIDEAELLKFFSKHAEELKAKPKGKRGALTLKDQKLNEEIRRLKNRNDKDDGKLILAAAFCAAVHEVGASMKSILRQKLELEYPAAVAGLDIPQARVFGKRLNDEIILEFQKLGAMLGAAALAR